MEKELTVYKFKHDFINDLLADDFTAGALVEVYTTLVRFSRELLASLEHQGHKIKCPDDLKIVAKDSRISTVVLYKSYLDVVEDMRMLGDLRIYIAPGQGIDSEV